MKYLVIKDRKLRNSFLEKDKNLFLNKFLKKKKSDNSGKISNRCVISYRDKSVLRFFKHSRILVREQALKGLYPGVIKSS